MITYTKDHARFVAALTAEMGIMCNSKEEIMFLIECLLITGMALCHRQYDCSFQTCEELALNSLDTATRKLGEVIKAGTN